MVPFFVQIKCHLGKSYEVANSLADAESASEIYSTAGDYDLLVKFYVEDGTDIGHFVNERGRTRPGLQATATILTFKAFCAPSPAARRAFGLAGALEAELAFAPQHEQAGRHHDRGAGDDPKRRHLAEGEIADHEDEQDGRVVVGRDHRGWRVAIAVGEHEMRGAAEQAGGDQGAELP